MNSSGHTSPLRIPQAKLRETFAELRRCGDGKRECQVIWTGPWATPREVTSVVHPRHRALGDGFVLDSGWLTKFWAELARTSFGVRVQVHTHPGRAFHSPTDDAWPLIHTAGFLSLVIPNFARGSADFSGVYLAELQEDGVWREVRPESRLEVM